MLQKKYIALVLLAGLCLFVYGCPANFIIVNQGQPIHVSGTYIHRGTGVQFPERFGSFARVAVTKYDETEDNISVGYNLHSVSEPIALTLYIYPASPTASVPPSQRPEVVKNDPETILQQHFDGVTGAVLFYHNDVKLLTKETCTLSQSNRILTGRKAIAQYKQKFAGQVQDVTSSVYLFLDNGWFIKYRVTCPTSVFDRAEETIEDFVCDFPVLPEQKKGQV